MIYGHQKDIFLFSFLAREGLYWLPFLLFAPLESGIVKQVFSTFADTFYWHNFFNEKSSKKVRLRISCEFVHSARVRRIFFMTAICRNKNCKKNPWLFILCVLKCLKQTIFMLLRSCQNAFKPSKKNIFSHNSTWKKMLHDTIIIIPKLCLITLWKKRKEKHYCAHTYSYSMKLRKQFGRLAQICFIEVATSYHISSLIKKGEKGLLFFLFSCVRSRYSTSQRLSHFHIQMHFYSYRGDHLNSIILHSSSFY